MPESQTGMDGPVTPEHDSNLAAIYVRTSSESQQFGYSIEEQLRRCFERCEFLNWDVGFIFRDEAESGKDIERPMFQQMMETAEVGHIDVIVFWKLDRFSRSLLHAVQLEKRLREYGVALHSVTEQIDTTTSAGRFNFRNIANAAEFEREMISERSQMGLRALAKENRWPNDQPPLGYQKRPDGKLEIDDEEAELVERIFDLYLDLKSMPQVAYELIQQGYTTKTGGEWTTRGVQEVLSNDIYAGVYSVGGVTEQIPEYQIISDDQFEEVVAVRHRFQSDSDASRRSMGSKRKADRVDEILDEYQTFLNERRTG